MSTGRLPALSHRASSALRAGPSSTLPSSLRLASSRATTAKASSSTTRTKSSSKSSSSSSSAAASKAPPPSPFHPWKNPETSRWRPALFSLRRQAQLANVAWRQGFLDRLPSAPKFDKLRKRLRTTVQLSEALSKGTPTTSDAWPPTKEGGPKSAPAKSSEKKALELARKLAASRGPYAGRSERRIFKGTKAQRTAPSKRAATAVKLKGMPMAIEEWRKSLREVKDKSRSSVPF